MYYVWAFVSVFLYSCKEYFMIFLFILIFSDMDYCTSNLNFTSLYVSCVFTLT